MIAIENRDSNKFIGYAMDYKSAIQLLIKNGLLHNSNIPSMVCCDCGYTKHHCCIGEDWEKTLFSWNIDKFNDYFGEYLYLTEEKMYEYEEEEEEE